MITMILGSRDVPTVKVDSRHADELISPMSPLASAFFFTWFAAALVWTINALRKPVPPGHRFPPMWLPAMVVSELGPVLLLARLAVFAVFVALGGPDNRLGPATVLLFIVGLLGLLVVIGRSFRASALGADSPSPRSLFVVRERIPSGVVKQSSVEYWNGLTLDLYHNGQGGPALIYMHPGSWMRGRTGRQARALFHRLANAGWVVADIDYPKSPQATFPQHVVGVKRAIEWVRHRAPEALHIDTERVVLSGGSAGAHLAAVAALTPNVTELQPGFEEVDTSVFACVPFYGIFDLLVRRPTRVDWPFIARHVMKAEPNDDPALYRLGSPIDLVDTDSPHFLVVHGDFDSVVLADESLYFAQELKAVSSGDVEYLEVPGGQHGFDAFASLRSRAVAERCVEWLESRLGNDEPSAQSPD